MIWWAGELHLQKNISVSVLYTRVFMPESLTGDFREVWQAGVHHSSESERPLTIPLPPPETARLSGLVPTAEPQWGVLLRGEQHGGQHPSRHVSNSQSRRCFLSVVFHSDGDHFYFFGRVFFFPPSRALLVARLVNYRSSNFQLKWKKRR